MTAGIYDVATLVTAGTADVTFSADGSLLYVAGENGDLDVYDVASREKIRSWDVGTKLGAISLSQDGTFVLVVEQQPVEGKATLYRVDLGTGGVKTISKTGGRFSDIEIIDADTVLLTGAEPDLMRLDLLTFTFSPINDTGINNLSVLTEDTRYTLIAEQYLSDGRLFLYDDVLSQIVADGSTYEGGDSGFNFGTQAISEKSGLVVQYTYPGRPVFRIYDLNLDYQRVVELPDGVHGTTFNRSGSHLYAFMPESGIVIKYDSSTWAEMERFDVGVAGWNSNDIGYGNQLLLGGDGRYISVLNYEENSGKLQLIDLTGRDESLTGTSRDDALEGFGGDDLIDGGAGNDRLDGGAGSDTLKGGSGSDFFIVDNVGDKAVETSASGGTDTVLSSVSFILGSHVENLTLTGAGASNGTGNALANRLTGNGAANVLDGGGGADTLNGGGGADTMIGGSGNDLYFVDNAGDKAVETSAGGGIDSVRSSVSFALGAHVENLSLTGTAAVDGTGNGLANALTGNSAANVLNGGGGADTMTGGAGSDVYVVDDVGDKTIESSSTGGVDEVRSSVPFTLGLRLERLTLTGNAAIDGTGNDQANILTGNGAANLLNGAGGGDQMSGGAGDDRYVVNHVGDQVIEAGSGGLDRVSSAIDYTLGANVENLILIGTAAIDGTGNALHNSMTGNGRSNRLDGGDGGDRLYGQGGGDALFGGSGDDRLFGGAGSDTLTGGGGRDGHYFDSALGAGDFDRIADFSPVYDTIFLDRDIFTGVATDGPLAAGAFRAGTAALDADDRILYDSATGHIRYDADGSGGGAAVLFAQVSAGTALTSADFVGYI